MLYHVYNTRWEILETKLGVVVSVCVVLILFLPPIQNLLGSCLNSAPPWQTALNFSYILIPSVPLGKYSIKNSLVFLGSKERYTHGRGAMFVFRIPIILILLLL